MPTVPTDDERLRSLQGLQVLSAPRQWTKYTLPFPLCSRVRFSVYLPALPVDEGDPGNPASIVYNVPYIRTENCREVIEIGGSRREIHTKLLVLID